MSQFADYFLGGTVVHKFVLLMACMIFSASAFAASTGGKSASGSSSSSSSSSDVKAANNQFGIQSISTNVDYTETGNGRLGTATGTLDTETGPVAGHGFYISAMKDALLGNDYFKATYDRSSGYTKYVGALQGGTYGSVVTTSSAVFANYSARYGKGFALRGSSMLTPYVEFGAHTWERGVNYGETYTNKYLGVGLLNQYSLGNRTVLSVDAMYGHTSQSAIVVNSGAGLIGFSGPLGDSELYKVGVSLDYVLAEALHWNVGFDYTAFSYGISAVYPSGTSLIWEPNSTTNYRTLRFGLGIGF